MSIPTLLLAPGRSRDRNGSVTPTISGDVTVVPAQFGEAWRLSPGSGVALVEAIPQSQFFAQTGEVLVGASFTILSRLTIVSIGTTEDTELVYANRGSSHWPQGWLVNYRPTERLVYGYTGEPNVAPVSREEFPDGIAIGTTITAVLRYDQGVATVWINGTVIDTGTPDHVSMMPDKGFSLVAGSGANEGAVVDHHSTVVYGDTALSDSEVQRLSSMDSAWTWESVQSHVILDLVDSAGGSTPGVDPNVDQITAFLEAHGVTVTRVTIIDRPARLGGRSQVEVVAGSFPALLDQLWRFDFVNDPGWTAAPVQTEWTYTRFISDTQWATTVSWTSGALIPTESIHSYLTASALDTTTDVTADLSTGVVTITAESADQVDAPTWAAYDGGISIGHDAPPLFHFYDPALQSEAFGVGSDIRGYRQVMVGAYTPGLEQLIPSWSSIVLGRQDNVMLVVEEPPVFQTVPGVRVFFNNGYSVKTLAYDDHTHPASDITGEIVPSVSLNRTFPTQASDQTVSSTSFVIIPSTIVDISAAIGDVGHYTARLTTRLYTLSWSNPATVMFMTMMVSFDNGAWQEITNTVIPDAQTVQDSWQPQKASGLQSLTAHSTFVVPIGQNVRVAVGVATNNHPWTVELTNPTWAIRQMGEAVER